MRRYFVLPIFPARNRHLEHEIICSQLPGPRVTGIYDEIPKSIKIVRVCVFSSAEENVTECARVVRIEVVAVVVTVAR
jgi:hypothetical protein